MCHTLHSRSSVFKKQHSNAEEGGITPFRQVEVEAAVAEMRNDASVWPEDCFCMKFDSINIPVRVSLNNVQLAVLSHLGFDCQRYQPKHVPLVENAH